MTEIAILRVTGPHFCAGIVYERGPDDRSWRFQRCAPYLKFVMARHNLKFLKANHMSQVLCWVDKHGYRYEWIASYD